MERPLVPLLHRWLPLLPFNASRADAPGAATIAVEADDGEAFARPDSAPVLRLGTVTAWVPAPGTDAVLAGTAGCRGRVRLDEGTARLTAPAVPADADAAAWDLYSMLTLSCALLLGRMRRALVHAAAVVAPDGRAWLLTGDTHAGKSTTSVNLIQAGWRFVTDDHGVLARGDDGTMRMEGWPRRFHLDEGWDAGAPVHRRGEVDPHQRWPGMWLRSAPVAGLLFPRVDAQQPTTLTRVAGSQALAGLMRQSPWLLADRARAADLLALLTEACSLPAYTLRLGLDTYRDTERLLDVLRPATGG